MKVKKSAIVSVLVLGLVGALATVPAFADDILFDNIVPGTSYTTDAYGINYYEQNTNSFVLGSSSTITGAVLGLWLNPGDSATDVDWQIVPTVFGSPNIAGGDSGVLSSADMGSILGGDFEMWQVTFDIPGVTLGPGTYYLEIDNVNTANGGGASWDVSNGPNSTGYIQDLSPLPASETFQILGNEGSVAATPEPSSFLLLGSGLAGLVGLIKRKLQA